MKFSIAVLTAVALSMGSVAAAPSGSYGNMNWNHYGVAPVPNGGYTNKANQACDQYGTVQHQYPAGIYPYPNNGGLHNIHGQRCSWTGKLVYAVSTGGWQVNGYACNKFGNVIKGLPRYVWPNEHGQYYNNHAVECTSTGHVISHGSGNGNGNGNGYQNGGGSTNSYGVTYKNGLYTNSAGVACDPYGHPYKLNKGTYPNPHGWGLVNINLKPCNANGVVYQSNYNPQPIPKPTYHPGWGYLNSQGDSTDSRGYAYNTHQHVYANQNAPGYTNNNNKACDYQGNTSGYTNGGSANGPATSPSANNYGGSSNGPATSPSANNYGGSSNGPATTPYDNNGGSTTPYTNTNGGSANGYIKQTGPNTYSINGQPCDQSGHIISKETVAPTYGSAKPAYPTDDDSSDNESSDESN